jgi:uncharacterized repeat protein (TIGR01451 family)
MRSLMSRLALAALLLLAAANSHAQFATGGIGLHKPRVFWLSWGAVGQNVYGGATISRNFNIAGYSFVSTCTLSNATTTAGTSTSLAVYTPGTWQGDGFDELYNIGGNHPGQGANPNTLSVGLATFNSTIEFDVSCSATFDGQPFALRGLVYSDVEASGGAEYVAARLTNGGTLRIIDQITQCGSASGVVTTTVGGFPEIQLNGAGGSCENNANPLLRGGPSLVGFIDGATRARLSLRGGGGSAIAIGVIAQFDYSEAVPASYGVAVHQFEQPFTGGVATAGVNFNNPANLAALQTSVRLGTQLQPDGGVIQPVGGPDVDALPKTTGPAGAGYANVPLANPLVPGTSTYTISNIVCDGGASSVAGWIDFNGNGTFDSATERSGVVGCPVGLATVALTWTLPVDYRPQRTSHLRLRLALPADAAALANPVGVSNSGEVEDYRLQLPGISNLRITKTNTPGVNGDVDPPDDSVPAGGQTTYTITATNGGPTAADGSLLTDPASAGLGCITVTCAASGGATCPVQTGAALISALQGAGAAIPVLPSGGAVTLQLTCDVTASGL